MKKLLLVILFLFSATLDARPFKFKIYQDDGSMMEYVVDIVQNNYQTLRTILSKDIDVAGFDIFNGTQFSSIDLPLTQENYEFLVQEHDRSPNIQERYIALFPTQDDEGVEE